MSELRAAHLSGLAVVAGWIDSEEICRRWSGASVSFPIDLEGLPEQIAFAAATSWCVVDEERVVGFGQVAAKEDDRLHLSHIIVAPGSRGKGFGRQLSNHLLQWALAESPKTVSLNVRTDNVVAIELYRSLGFNPTDRPGGDIDDRHHYMVHSPLPQKN